MGLRSSGRVASCAFINRVESTMLTAPMLVAGTMRGYLRCEDDVLLHALNLQVVAEWLDEFRERAGYFRIKVEKHTRTGMTHMNVLITVHQDRFFVDRF